MLHCVKYRRKAGCLMETSGRSSGRKFRAIRSPGDDWKASAEPRPHEGLAYDPSSLVRRRET